MGDTKPNIVICTARKPAGERGWEAQVIRLRPDGRIDAQHEIRCYEAASKSDAIARASEHHPTAVVTKHRPRE